jgi:membrane protease YdiL (CAAX protease family)
MLLEITYLYSRTKLLNSGYYLDLSVIRQELSWTVLRAISLAVVLYACWRSKTFLQLFIKPTYNRTTIILLIVFFAITILTRKHSLSALPEQLTFAATTTFVAAREELVFRYVIQNWWEGWFLPKDKFVGSIFFTSILFTFYHIGAQPLYALPWIFLASVLLGAIYHYSGKSLPLVVVCHFICDLFYL